MIRLIFVDIFTIKPCLAMLKFSIRRIYRFAIAIGLAIALVIAPTLWREGFTAAQPASTFQATSSAYQVIVALLNEAMNY
jgi:hypothetical protein